MRIYIQEIYLWKKIRENPINPKIFLRLLIFLYRIREIKRRKYCDTKKQRGSSKLSKRHRSMHAAHFDKNARRYHDL